jgi:hypothetical protein
MAEGRTKAYYESDILLMNDGLAGATPGSPINAQFVVDVPNNLFGQANLAWNAVAPIPTGPTGIKLSKRLRPRHAIGVTSTGRRVRVIVPHTSASLWRNPAGTWTFIDNFGATITATVTGFVGEAATV